MVSPRPRVTPMADASRLSDRRNTFVSLVTFSATQSSNQSLKTAFAGKLAAMPSAASARRAPLPEAPIVGCKDPGSECCICDCVRQDRRPEVSAAQVNQGVRNSRDEPREPERMLGGEQNGREEERRHAHAARIERDEVTRRFHPAQQERA